MGNAGAPPDREDPLPLHEVREASGAGECGQCERGTVWLYRRLPLIQSLHEGGAYEGDAARAVREIASAAGVEFDAEAARAVPPDHLGCELLLWDALAARDPEAATEFARRHLTWAVAPLGRNAEGTGFYSGLRTALAALLTELA